MCSSIDHRFRSKIKCFPVDGYKSSGGDGIPAELFQILKDDVVKSAAFNMLANLENTAVATELEKVSFHSNPKEG